ncbi:MAG TPA: 4Fe-4S binding protein [Acidobacteriaceae bacterium]|jgi:polyferredoxin|nr:4Fe-4S binding protein [Acidobacteriaceae bacterium]
MTMQLPEPALPTPPQPKKKLVRRSAPDRSQRIRRIVQGLFVALNAWIGLQFFLWVRRFERGGQGLQVGRPAGVEGWLPIAGLMNLKYLILTRHVSPIHPAAMFLLIAFLLMSLFLKKAFCSWLCPVGTLSEYLWKMGRRLFGRNLTPPRWLDRTLRSLKYILLAFFVGVIGSMSAEALAGFMLTPYGLIADVKMLDFFRTLTLTGVIVLGVLAGLSLLIQNFWCRYLCPYGALMGLVSLLSPTKIRRDAEACIDCGKCSKACPGHLQVDQLIQIRSVECSACLACVAACPVENALQFALPPQKAALPAERWRGRVLRPGTVAAMIAIFFFGLVLFARMTGHWRTPIPNRVYQQLVPNANSVSHPM